MRTVIVNELMSPGLFKVLQVARKDGTRYDGCYVTKYEEYTTAGGKLGQFTLGDPGDEAPLFVL